jgi:hypothetical protein
VIPFIQHFGASSEEEMSAEFTGNLQYVEPKDQKAPLFFRASGFSIYVG